MLTTVPAISLSGGDTRQWWGTANVKRNVSCTLCERNDISNSSVLLNRVCSLHDFLDDPAFRISIMLHVAPLTLSKVAFDACVLIPVGIVASEPITETQHSSDFRSAFAEYMQVDVCVWPFEQAMFKPFRFPNA